MSAPAGLLRRERPAAADGDRGAASRSGKSWIWRAGNGRPGLVLAAFGVVLAGAAALRLWDLDSKPGWQSDETVYADIARNLATSGSLSEHIQYHEGWTPFLFHPPFYFLLLAGWFKLAGAGVVQARLLAVIASLLTLCLLMRLIWRLHGPVPALVTVAFVAFDGWLLFVQRVSYIENTLMVIIVAGLVLYERALRRPSARRFVIAGIVIGFAAVFKHTGAYMLLAVVLNWLIIRREKRNHWLLLAGAGSVIVAYLAVMIPLFDHGRHDWYLQQTLVQLQRVVGLRRSQGTLTSPGEFLHLIGHQYVIFAPSLAAALAGAGFITVRCVRARSLDPVRHNSLLLSWAAAGVIVFGASAIRYQQYFELVLIPLYCVLWTEVCRWVRAHPRALPAVAVAGALVMAAGLGTFCIRVLDHHDNVLEQARLYAERDIPQRSVVVAAEEIGDEIPQQWCTPARAGVCGAAASYAITDTSYLQQAAPPADHAFWAMMAHATRVTTFTGFKESVTVWRLARPRHAVQHLADPRCAGRRADLLVDAQCVA
jgi:4-amino-4-deoxy-L-arabinose transferase-like glycosyltransferase